MRLPDNAYLKTASFAAGAEFDHPFFMLSYALRLLRVLVLLGLWRIVLADHVDSGPLSLAGVLTYTLIAEVFAEQLNVRTTLNQAFWEGTLVIRFLRPMGLVRQLSAEMVGPWGVDFVLFSHPPAGCCAAARRRPAPRRRPPLARCSSSACAWPSWSAWPWSC